MVESTLSGLSLAQQLRQSVAAGYHIPLIYVFLPTWELSASRVAGRVLEGGHDRNGRIYYEMPDGSIQTENPYPELLRQRGIVPAE